MHKKLSAENDDYLFTIYYQGKKYNYKLSRYNHDRQFTYWHFYSKSQVQELKWDIKAKQLSQVLLFGQTPFPDDFINALAEEFKRI
jgi:hypothetical protein